MSGNGPDIGTPNPPPNNGSDPCEQLSFDAHLASMNAAVVSTLNTGDVLPLQIQTQSSGLRAIVALSPGGQVAGSIAVRVSDLLRCIQQGHTYSATVLSANGGAVQVHVAHD